MADPYEIIDLELKDLLDKAREHKAAGYRLGQICCVRTEGGYDLLYSYVLEYKMINYKIAIAETEEVPTMEEIFPTAKLYENEMSELFGVNIHFATPDGNKMYRIAAETPFK